MADNEMVKSCAESHFFLWRQLLARGIDASSTELSTAIVDNAPALATRFGKRYSSAPPGVGIARERTDSAGITGYEAMKPDIHPQYNEIKVICSCGNEFQTKSTLSEELHIDVCSACHPFYTGTQKIVDTAGRVDKFRRKYGMS